MERAGAPVRDVQRSPSIAPQIAGAQPRASGDAPRATPAADVIDAAGTPRRVDVQPRDSGLVRRDGVEVAAPPESTLNIVLRDLEARGDGNDDLRFQANLLRSVRDSVASVRQRTFVAAANARVREETARTQSALQTTRERESFQESMRIRGNTSELRFLPQPSSAPTASTPEPEPVQQFMSSGDGGDGGDGGGGDGDPLMLDLNHDDRLGVTGYSTAKGHGAHMDVRAAVDFDLDGDGTRERIEWMDGLGDGMLVDDRDGGVTAAAGGDGSINGTRLFGDEGGRFTNGYEKLSHLDTDRSGAVEGSELNGLKVWVDDGDARVEAGELKTLVELGISSISVRMRLEENERGELLMRSSFTQNGVERLSEDVWFATDRTPRLPVDRLFEHIQDLIASDPPSNVLEAALRDMDKVLADVNKWSKHLADLVEDRTQPLAPRGDPRSVLLPEGEEPRAVEPQVARRESGGALRTATSRVAETALRREAREEPLTALERTQGRLVAARADSPLRRS